MESTTTVIVILFFYFRNHELKLIKKKKIPSNIEESLFCLWNKMTWDDTFAKMESSEAEIFPSSVMASLFPGSFSKLDFN